MKMPDLHAPDTIQAIVDSDGRVLAKSRALEDWLPLIGHEPQNSLFEALARCETLVTEDNSPILPPEEEMTRLYLRWGPYPTMVALLRMEEAGKCCYSVTVHPLPAESLPAPIAEILSSPHRVSQLFLKLQKAESRLDSYMSHFPGVFFHQRIDLSFEYVSPNVEKLIGLPPQRLLKSGSQFLGLIFEKDRDFFMREIRKHNLRRASFSLQYRVRKPKDASVVYLTDVRSPVFSESGLLMGYEGVWLDTTRQYIAERKLTSAAWKENLAMLTAGLVHDFSNVMAGIYALSELYHASMSPEDRMYEGLGQIKKSSMEARRLVRRIIDLNREVSGQRSYHDPEKLILDQVDLLKVVFPKGTRLDLNLTGTEIPVYIDDVEFRQVLLNLAMNAKDAFEKDGTITLTTRKINPGDEILTNCLKGSRLAERSGIEIQFCDNGSGIPQAHHERIFQSFFTTKEIHKGSGFGLYNVHRIIKSFHGEIDFESRDGCGTIFHIFVPEADFTEDHLGNPEITLSNTEDSDERPMIIVVSDTDVSQFEIVSLMRSRQWEVIIFARIDRLSDFIRESPKIPSITLIVGPDENRSIQSIRGLVHAWFPSSKVALIPMGKNPDDIPVECLSHVDLILDPASQPSSQILEIEKLVLPTAKKV